MTVMGWVSSPTIETSHMDQAWESVNGSDSATSAVIPEPGTHRSMVFQRPR